MISLRAQTLLLFISAIATIPSSASRSHVHPGVHRTLQAQGSVNLIVTLSDSTESVLEGIKEAEFATRGDKIASLVERLEAHASRSQASIHDMIDNSSTMEATGAQPLFKSTTSFWINNQVHFEAATFELVEKLSLLESVAEMREELVFSIPTPIVSIAANSSNPEAVRLLATNEWGITKISAADVWAQGYNGQGIIVGIIDTGVLSTHMALKNSFRSSYGWYDPINRTRVPSDDDGHGTHVTGTIVGSEGIGVAPGATWMACKGCLSTTKCSESALITCGQYMTCPTTPTGAGKDCSKAPRLVSNSWGGAQGNRFYDAVIATWRAAGIVPVFAMGNEGPVCQTANSPGDSKSVIGVGSTTITDGLSSFSSKGPGTGGVLKPDVSAPGENVRSAWNNGAYSTISGTSMAAPHVSGVIALLLSARSNLTYDDVKSVLFGTAQRDSMKVSGYTCGGTSDSAIPNNQYGYGRVNALAAFNNVMNSTPAPTPEPPVFDRCSGLNEVFCAELLCEWNGDSGSCSSWL